MPEVALRLRPTVNTEFTPTLNESGISSCNLIRFKAGVPEKLGGWQKYYAFAFGGTILDLHAWQDLNSNGWLGIGTTQELAVLTNGTLSDITPQVFTSNFAPNFSTTSGSATVEVDDPNIANVTTLDSVFFNTPISVGGIILSGLCPIVLIAGTTRYQITAATLATSTVSNGGAVPQITATNGTAQVNVSFAGHGQSVGNTVVFQIPTTVANLTIDGAYSVILVGSLSQYSISASAQASSTATVSMNSGNAQLEYLITLGPPATGTGYGIGGYGLGGYGSGAVPSVQTGTPIMATDWTSDNWGEIYIACADGGPIYYWQPSGGFQIATPINTGPPFNGGVFIAMPAQILVAWGSSVTEDIGVQQDPLLVRWSDSQDFTQWSVTSATQAGSFRIPTGSEIRGGLQGPQQSLIWTDLDLWSMQYLGAPLVFGFNKISSGCGLLGRHAATTMRGIVYWMSNGNFFQLSGNGIQEISCSVWDVVFQNLDEANQSKCVAAANSAFDEITFYYPSKNGGGIVDSYVKHNTEEKSWDYGSLSRTAWVDQSVLGQPLGASAQGLIYQHETTYNADGQPMQPYFETGWFTIAEAQDMAFVDWFFPDMKFGTVSGSPSATVSVTISTTNYPNGTVRSFGPFTMTAAKTFINCRLRGRQIKLRFASNDLDSFWRLGLMRYRVAGDGRR
jgi:hypothetical protein